MNSKLSTTTNEQSITTPAELTQQLPLAANLQAQIAKQRLAIQKIISGEDKRLIVVVGPCSTHDSAASLDYAQRLVKLQEKVADKLLLVMRVYLEKPRTCLGWKGMVNDPDRDASNNLNKGLLVSRQLMLQIAQLGLPLATEALNPFLAPYFEDLVSWYALGARTTESQTHREMASQLPGSLGFKNGTDGGFSVAINAIKAAAQPQQITRINSHGQLVLSNSPGNQSSHLVLRGGNAGPNYYPEQVTAASQALLKAGVNHRVMIDASHANCGKVAERQQEVLESVGQQLQANQPILGVMLESFLVAGQQPLQAGEGTYGQSMTDPCLDWQATSNSLIKLAQTVKLTAQVAEPA
ncbi:3-deoxy-7-phosphoheptulonate synthase [Marinospirillum insulare]|uniref:Phospho-2-dehydro-3-deoxyheptonate aldolase n=1 Tax=Marinospirillum insulare TaxID=217169 RepID=A0ABQ5ZV95_9GAMM|nr:3-deoxy-7-phosphoheptulonate synthase [Marinospirillum insulare]GLR62967.1 phospho-2-dehydro-3-deoxyheptonate aldolase [Marinospirillum insulare]